MLLRAACLALASSLALGAPAAYAAPPGPTVVETSNVKAPRSSPSDATGYAERETQDPEAADFQGGDLLVVSISGGAMIVLLLLLLILA